MRFLPQFFNIHYLIFIIMLFSNFKKSFLGSIDLTLKVKTMRKAQEFCVYPFSAGQTTIHIQSDKRWADIDLNTGIVEMTSNATGHHNRWLLAWQKARNKHETYQMTAEQIETIKTELRKGSENGKTVSA